MAASPSVTEELTCSICLELFEEPVLLSCAHTFCRQCLREFCVRHPAPKTGKGEGEGETILCPKCRATIKLGKDGIQGLPKNTTLANIILSFDEDMKKRELAPCDVCDSDPPRAGFKSCSECNLTYCRACFPQLHPLRGAFMHHVITSPGPLERSADQSERGPKSPPTLRRVRSISPPAREQEYMAKLRQNISSKRKELKNTLKAAQDLLKATEDETEDQMKQIKTVSSRLHEAVAEREGALLAGCTRRRHEAVTCIYSLISDAQSQMLEIDILDERFGQLLLKAAAMDISQELSSLEERLAILASTELSGHLDDVPMPRKLRTVHVQHALKDMDFKHETEIPPPIVTDILPRPVAKGPAVIDVKWAGPGAGMTYRMTAWRRTQKGRTERIIVDDVSGGSHMMLLPGVDAQYRLTVSIVGKTKEGEAKATGGDVTLLDSEVTSDEKVFRTLPYVNCLSVRFDPAYSHKLVAVTSSHEEVMHRKCKLSNLQDTCPAAAYRKLDALEGAVADTAFPPLPHMYWEVVVHFHVISRLEDSKLLCDLGVCKVGMEDGCALVCDNHKTYCCYLVKRNRFITLEFWNGPNQEILGRSLNVADLDKENEKTMRLGFYLDIPRRLFAVVNPAASTVLAQFNVKFANLVFLCGLYCPDQVYCTVKVSKVTNVPTVVVRLMKAHAAGVAAGGNGAEGTAATARP